MISLRARITKQLLKIFASRKAYQKERIPQHRKTFDRNMRLLFGKGGNAERTKLASVSVEWLGDQDVQTVVVYVHGGGFMFGSPAGHRTHMQRVAEVCNARVLAIDYDLAPEHPFPQAIEQIVSTWKELRKSVDPAHVMFMGDSAGGNLVLAALLKLRNEKQVLPACAVLLSPALDATFSGESYKDKAGVDPLLNMQKMQFFMENYTQGHNRRDQLVSPIFANPKDLPPILIHVGSEELLLSDSQTFYRKAMKSGIDVSLFVGKGLWHGWHMFAGFVPEARQAMQEIGTYVRKHTG